MNTAAPAPIAILGGGPAGLACALMLARSGRASVVLDAQAPGRAHADRRLLALGRGSWQIIGPLLARPPERATISDVYVSSEGEFGATHIGAADFGGIALGATVFYGDLVAALEDAAATTPLIEQRRPRTVVDVRQAPNDVRVHCDNGEVVTATLAINAEGWAGFGDEPKPRRDAPMALVGDVGLEKVAPGSAFERFTREGPLALLPRPGSNALRSLVWCMPADVAQQRMQMQPDTLLAELQRAVGRRIGAVVSLGTLNAFRLNERMRAEVRAHRCVAIGNAAQTLHPVAGQGFNLALRDCASLIDALVAAHGDVAAALAAYERRRRVDRAAITTVTRWLPRVFATRFAPVGAARSLGLTMLDLVPPLRNELAHLLMFGVR